MRVNPVPVGVVLALVVAVAGSAWMFAHNEAGHFTAAQRVASEPSAERVGLTITYASGPLAREEYNMSDINGASSATYRAVGRSGSAVTVRSLPRETYDVSFLFGALVRDGIWELQSKPPRGDTSRTYTMDVYQLVTAQHGSHTFTFTDPHYWATTAGHEFQIHLDKSKPVPNLLTLTSTVPVEPRYGKLLEDFRTFGSPEFQAQVAAARQRAVKLG